MSPSMVAFLKEVYGQAKQGSRQVPHVAAASVEVLVENDGGLVFLGHAPEHCMCSNGRGVPESHTAARLLALA